MKRSIITIVLLIAAGCTAAINAHEQTKSFHKRFSVDQHTKLDVDVSYGNIFIETWDSAAVDIQVELRVIAKKESRAIERINSMRVEISKRDNVVLLEVRKEQERSKFVSINTSNNSVRIDNVYTIKMPKDMDIEIDHRYGNISFDELAGLVDIDLKYGSLKGRRLSRGREQKLNSLELKYGRLELDEVGWLNIDVGYSKVNIETARALALESKYSTISVSTLGSLACESKYDNYNLRHVDKITGASSYTHFTLHALAKLASLEMRYGELKVHRVKPGFSVMQCDGSYTDISISFDSKARFAFEARNSYGNIDCRGMKQHNSRTGGSKSYVDGEDITGGPSERKGTVRLSTQHASINLDTI